MFLMLHSCLLAVTGLRKEVIVRDAIHKKLISSFLSLQAEKTFFRDAMLNEYLYLQEKKGIITPEENNSLKRY